MRNRRPRVRFASSPRAKKRRQLGTLLQEETQFRTLYENAAVGIVLADVDGRPHECNPAFERMFGYTEAELRTMRIDDLTHPDDIEETRGALQALVNGELEHSHTERRFVRKDGSTVWTHIIASTVPRVNGEVALTLATIEDISGRKLAEATAAAERDYATDLMETTSAIVVGLDSYGRILV
ncbi:MAG: PAS domain S-box protein [Gaiellaceae bacterium]